MLTLKSIRAIWDCSLYKGKQISGLMNDSLWMNVWIQKIIWIQIYHFIEQVYKEKLSENLDKALRR